MRSSGRRGRSFDSLQSPRSYHNHTQSMVQFGRPTTHLAGTHLASSARARAARHGSQSTASALANATTARPVVQIRRIRAPTMPAVWAGRGRPAPSPPRRTHPPEARRPHTRRAATRKLPEPRPRVADVGQLCPRPSAAVDPVRDGSRGGACRATSARPARKCLACDATSLDFQRVVGRSREAREEEGEQEWVR